MSKILDNFIDTWPWIIHAIAGFLNLWLAITTVGFWGLWGCIWAPIAFYGAYKRYQKDKNGTR